MPQTSKDPFADPPSKDELASAAKADPFADAPSKDELHAVSAPSREPSDWERYKGYVGEAWDNEPLNPKNVWAALSHVGENVPILGPLTKRAAQAIIPQQYVDEQDAKDKAFADEHPGANIAARLIAAGAAPMSVPKISAPAAGASALARAATGIGNAGIRVASNAALAGADAAARGEDATDAAEKGALVGGVLEGGIGAAKLLPSVARKVANVIGGVKEPVLEEYLANRGRINEAGARSTADTKDIIDQAVGAGLKDRDELVNTADTLESKLSDKYRAKQADLNSVTPLAKAQQFSAALGNTKAKLHEMSDAADDALVNSGITFEKGHLLDAIDRIGHGAGDAIGDETTQALTKLQATRDRINAQLPDQIPAKRLRSALKQIRRDINFDQGSGEFNDELNGMRKAFTHQISEALQKAVPDYAEKMEHMAPIAENLGQMNRYFGDDSKALGSLETLRRGGKEAQLIQQVIEGHAASTGDRSLIDSLKEMRGNQSLLGRMKAGEDLRAELHPEDWKILQEAKANAEMAENSAAGYERLGENRTYGVAKSGLRDNNTSFLDKEALDALGNTDGNDYNQLLKDKAIHDQFFTERPNGSRMAKIGTVTGAALGHLVGQPLGGAAIGANVGGVVDKYGPRMVKSIADTVLDSRASSPILQKAAESVAENGLPPQLVPQLINAEKVASSDDGTSKIKSMLSSTDGIQRLGRFAAPLQAAAAKSPQALAVTHYMLSQQEPEYSKMMGTKP